MTRLDLLDPTSADDPAFDPHGPQAARVRLAATARRQPASPRPRPHVRRLALAGAAVVAAAAVVLAVGTGTQPPDARAALARAVEKTASFDSGRIVLTVEFDSPGSGPRGNGRTEVRFDDGDLESVMRSEVVADGRKMRVHGTGRQIDGVQYARDDTQPGARFQRLGKASDTDPARLLVEQVGSKALVDLVRDAEDLSERKGAGGQTVYRGTRTAGEVEDAAPTAAGRSQGAAWDRPVTLEVAVDEEGLIRRVTITDPNSTRTIEYVDLGIEQTIERPGS